MVGLRSGGTSPLPPRTAARVLGKIARVNAKKKFCFNDVSPACESYYKRILDES